MQFVQAALFLNHIRVREGNMDVAMSLADAICGGNPGYQS
jgi:hypothetical protein